MCKKNLGKWGTAAISRTGVFQLPTAFSLPPPPGFGERESFTAHFPVSAAIRLPGMASGGRGMVRSVSPVPSVAQKGKAAAVGPGSERLMGEAQPTLPLLPRD